METAMKAHILGIAALLGVIFAVTVAEAAPLQLVQAQTPAGQTGGAVLPASITSQINAAIKSGNTQTISTTIQQLIAANPSLADQIAEYAVAQDPNDAPIIAVAAAQAVSAQGGNPASIVVAILGSVEAQILPGGPGAPGANDSQFQSVLDQILTQVQNSVPLTQGELRELAADVNILIQYTPPPAFLPPAHATVPSFFSTPASPTSFSPVA
jgi:hypothetical protein